MAWSFPVTQIMAHPGHMARNQLDKGSNSRRLTVIMALTLPLKSIVLNEKALKTALSGFGVYTLLLDRQGHRKPKGLSSKR